MNAREPAVDEKALLKLKLLERKKAELCLRWFVKKVYVKERIPLRYLPPLFRPVKVRKETPEQKWLRELKERVQHPHKDRPIWVSFEGGKFELESQQFQLLKFLLTKLRPDWSSEYRLVKVRRPLEPTNRLFRVVSLKGPQFRTARGWLKKQKATYPGYLQLVHIMSDSIAPKQHSMKTRQRLVSDVVDLTEDDDPCSTSKEESASPKNSPKMDEDPKDEKLERRKKDLKCLLEDGVEGWLNDIVVFDYMRMNIPNCIVVDPVVWNDEYDIQKYDVPVSTEEVGCGLILIPVCYFDHWLLAAFDIKSGLIVYFDTMRNKLLGELQRKVLVIAKKLQERFAEKNRQGKHFPLQLRSASDSAFPQQEDESSCGPYTCMIAQAIAKSENLDFSQADIVQWRKETYDFLLNNEPPPLPRRRRRQEKNDAGAKEEAMVVVKNVEIAKSGKPAKSLVQMAREAKQVIEAREERKRKYYENLQKLEMKRQKILKMCPNGPNTLVIKPTRHGVPRLVMVKKQKLQAKVEQGEPNPKKQKPTEEKEEEKQEPEDEGKKESDTEKVKEPEEEKQEADEGEPNPKKRKPTVEKDEKEPETEKKSEESENGEEERVPETEENKPEPEEGEPNPKKQKVEKTKREPELEKEKEEPEPMKEKLDSEAEEKNGEVEAGPEKMEQESEPEAEENEQDAELGEEEQEPEIDENPQEPEEGLQEPEEEEKNQDPELEEKNQDPEPEEMEQDSEPGEETQEPEIDENPQEPEIEEDVQETENEEKKEELEPEEMEEEPELEPKEMEQEPESKEQAREPETEEKK